MISMNSGNKQQKYYAEHSVKYCNHGPEHNTEGPPQPAKAIIEPPIIRGSPGPMLNPLIAPPLPVVDMGDTTV